MREILFRGKRLDNGEWVEGNFVNLWLIHYKKHQPIITDDKGVSFDVDPSTVGQYTGLTDKNGKRIFEGDIVEGRDYDAEDGYGVVNWEDGAFYVSNDSWNGTFCDNYWGYDFEVIGNIHDNPELLLR